jgi:hypothetical protein
MTVRMRRRRSRRLPPTKVTKWERGCSDDAPWTCVVLALSERRPVREEEEEDRLSLFVNQGGPMPSQPILAR